MRDANDTFMARYADARRHEHAHTGGMDATSVSITLFRTPHFCSQHANLHAHADALTAAATECCRLTNLDMNLTGTRTATISVCAQFFLSLGRLVDR